MTPQPKAPDNALSTEAQILCEACGKFKTCRLYLLQDCASAWVCSECRKPKAPVDAVRDALTRLDGEYDLMETEQSERFTADLTLVCDFVRAALGDAADTAWLIEKDDPPVYFQLEYDDDWTPDASKALRFARREDAQAYIDHIGWTEPRAVEHMWPVPRVAGGAR